MKKKTKNLFMNWIFPPYSTGLQVLEFYKPNAVAETELKMYIKTRHLLYVLRSWYEALLRCSFFQSSIHYLFVGQNRLALFRAFRNRVA